MLFKGFITEEKDSVNVTEINVIEASVYDSKVSERAYLLTEKTNTWEYWRGRRYDTNQVSLQRIHNGETFTNYWPRTYINPIDIVLVIDRSGSMGSTKMQAAKVAAKFFVDNMSSLLKNSPIGKVMANESNRRTQRRGVRLRTYLLTGAIIKESAAISARRKPRPLDAGVGRRYGKCL